MNWQQSRTKRQDYHQKNLNNPFFKKDAKRGSDRVDFVWPKLSLKLLAWPVLFIGASGLMVYGIFLSDFFAINKILVSAPTKFSSSSIESMAWAQSHANRFFLPQKNLFLFDVGQLKASINSQYAASNLVIKKNFPNQLSISFDEKVYSAIWREGDNHYLANENDDIALPININDYKDKKLPMVINTGTAKYANGYLPENHLKIAAISIIYANISKNIKFQVDNFEIPGGEGGVIEVKIVNGPRLIFTTRSDLDKQLNKLYTIINERLKNDFIKKTYIDLRFNDTIYTK